MITERKIERITGTDVRGKVRDKILSVVETDDSDFVRFFNNKTSDFIDTELQELKKNEPTSDNEFFRLTIINYEFGDLNRAIVYSNRFKDTKKTLFRDGFKTKDVILSEGKLAMADLLTQLNMLCISLGRDFSELRKLGMEHLKERQKDFQRDGWSEVNK